MQVTTVLGFLYVQDQREVQRRAQRFCTVKFPGLGSSCPSQGSQGSSYSLPVLANTQVSSRGEADQLTYSHPFTCCTPNFGNKTSRKAWSLPSGSGRPPHHVTGSHNPPWPGANGHRLATYQEGTAESHQLRNRRVQREVLCEMGSHLWVKVESFTLFKVPLGFHTRTHKLNYPKNVELNVCHKRYL